jgi:RNA polymerase sigma-70 factor, ECF subfamily
MTTPSDDTDALVALVAQGHRSAADQLLERHRGRLVAMVRLRMDRRLAARCDPSDVVQETLAEAHRKLRRYAELRPMPFYAWLRSIAWERIIQLHRLHVRAQRRSVDREEPYYALAEGSGLILAEKLASAVPSAASNVMRRERLERVRDAIGSLPDNAREVIVLRHLEDMSFKEICAVLGLSEDAVYARYRRAVERLTRLLKSESS